MFGRRKSPVARNARRITTWRFIGDPAGTALTQAVRGQSGTRSMQGRSGFPYIGDKGSAERAFSGVVVNSPQPALQGKVLAGNTTVIFKNGPSDLSSVPSAVGGSAILDARYRALAMKVAAQR